MPKGKPGTKPSGTRRAVGLYALFVDGPLAEVQAHIRDYERLGRDPSVVETIEYLYRHWKQTREDQS